MSKFGTTDERMERIDEMEEEILDQLGSDEAFSAVSAALSYDVKSDVYEYIMRSYDIGVDDDEEDEEFEE